MSEDFVCRFVEEAKPLIEERSPSFFEITTLMAFDYFRQAQVDFAVIEVGLGGQLDCTNIIPPIVSVITSISKDHTQLLGDTLEAIAREKAGIIKPHTPVIIGRGESPEVREVFVKKAAEEEAPIIFAEEAVHIKAQTPEFPGQSFTLEGKEALPYYFGLGGLVQRDNFRAIYATIQELRSQGIAISEETFRDGLRYVVSLTGLRGRWEVLSQHPALICDTAHNEDGVRYIVEQLRSYSVLCTSSSAWSMTRISAEYYNVYRKKRVITSPQPPCHVPSHQRTYKLSLSSMDYKALLIRRP